MDRYLFAKRKSYIEIGEIFFWTATINNWQRLLLKDEYKNVIINSLSYLSQSGKIDVFAFPLPRFVAHETILFFKKSG
jgi:hypothetical protein